MCKACPLWAPALAFSRVFFEHVHQYRAVYQALVRSESGPTVTRGLKRIVADVVRAEFSSTGRPRRENEVPRDALVQFTVDALFSILDWWFEHNPKLSPANADAVFRRLVLPALAAAGIS